MKFEDYLSKVFQKANPTILDDDMPEAYEHWLTTLDVQELIDHAEKWGLELTKEVREMTLAENRQ